MPLILEPGIIEIINSSETAKVLVTVDEAGSPHAVVKESIRLNGEGIIEYFELLESSHSYRNLTRSLWFDKPVSILLHTRDGRSCQIKGKPVRIVVSGPEFEKKYVRIRETLGDVDLAAVCFIEPEEVRDESYATRFARQEAERPFFKHLDRIAR